VTDAGGGPEIAFPPDGARVDLGLARGAAGSLGIRLGAGAPPFRWLVDGVPFPVDPFARQAEWRPDGIGFVDLAVIDARGRAARASVFLE
jgi:penicillin-binding protein 1C